MGNNIIATIKLFLPWMPTENTLPSIEIRNCNVTHSGGDFYKLYHGNQIRLVNLPFSKSVEQRLRTDLYNT